MAKRKLHRTSEDIAFEYNELLTAIIRDLEHINQLIPAESSRVVLFGETQMSTNAAYIIQARKNDLLGYIQTICQDHIEWGRKLLDRGWTAERDKSGQKGSE